MSASFYTWLGGSEPWIQALVASLALCAAVLVVALLAPKLPVILKCVERITSKGVRIAIDVGCPPSSETKKACPAAEQDRPKEDERR